MTVVRSFSRSPFSLRAYVRGWGYIGMLGLAWIFFSTGCAFPPRQWSSREQIQKTIQENLPLGTSREALLKFFADQGIRVNESSPSEVKNDRELGVRFVTRRSLLVTTSVVAVFAIGNDGKVEKVVITPEQHTGL